MIEGCYPLKKWAPNSSQSALTSRGLPTEAWSENPFVVRASVPEILQPGSAPGEGAQVRAAEPPQP
jgi:hypothetical protein